MTEKGLQPREGDVVLGRNTTPEGAVVLGGKEGILQRIRKSDNEQERIAAINQAVNYGNAGLDLVIEALKNESELSQTVNYRDACLNLVIKALKNNSVEIQEKAYLFLRGRKEARVKQALQNCNLYQFFECINTLLGHSNSVFSLAITPNGERLVSASRDNTIKIWDFTNKNCLYSLSTFKAHSEEITSLAE